MKKTLSFGPIKEKIENVEVMGQGCLNDCQRSYWEGSNSVWHLLTNECTKEVHYDAHWSTEY